MPYRTHDGFVGLKVWNQVHHAEFEVLTYDDTSLIIRCALHGDWRDPAEVELVASRASTLTDARAVATASVIDGTARFTLDVERLQGVWLARAETLYLGVRAADLESVPLATCMSDVPDLRKRRMFPPIELIDDVDDEVYHSTPDLTAWATPVYVRDNALAIRLAER